MGRRLSAACVLAALAAVPATASAAWHSLYHGPGPRPGPGLLYAHPAYARQLTNAGPWTAKPILISGATSYRNGEFLYQDFLYDDNGARLTADPSDPRAGGNLFSKQNATYTYPTGPALREQRGGPPGAARHAAGQDDPAPGDTRHL